MARAKPPAADIPTPDPTVPVDLPDAADAAQDGPPDDARVNGAPPVGEPTPDPDAGMLNATITNPSREFQWVEVGSSIVRLGPYEDLTVPREQVTASTENQQRRGEIHIRHHS
jgi:hypothetical protein